MNFLRRLTAIALLMSSNFAVGGEQQVLQIATIIPDGTGAASALKTFGKSVSDETNGEIKLKFQWGGLAGSDKAVLEGLKAGTIQGALFAGQILSELAPAIREIELPFQFGSDQKKGWAFAGSHRAAWEKDLAKSGVHSLGFYEAGLVYLVSRKPFAGLKDIQGANIWSWPSDKISHAVIEELKGKAVDVPVEDSFKALSDGRVDFAYAPAIAVTALQWYTKCAAIMEQPLSYAVGAMVIDEKVWTKMSTAQQGTISKLAAGALSQVNDSSRSDEAEALKLLTTSGMKVVKLNDADIKVLRGLPAKIKAKMKFK